MTTTRDNWIEDYFPRFLKDDDGATKEKLSVLRAKFAELGDAVETSLGDGRRKAVVRTKLEEAAMWAAASLIKG